MTLTQRVAAIYVELRLDVYRYVLSLGVGPDTAQEVTQDAFLRLFETLQKGTAVNNGRAWLLAVAHNLSVNVLTAKSSMTEELSALHDVSAHAGTEQRLIEEQRRHRLREEVSRLSRQQRACLELRAQGLRYREIGEVMGISTSAVAEFLRRAVLLLRRAVNE
jgi:RNA polymerase sigma-70 factor (ECF subfamily)